jgi:lipid-binding SYLF domain-containing protein
MLAGVPDPDGGGSAPGPGLVIHKEEEKINMLIPTIRDAARVVLAGAAVALAVSSPAWSQESNQQRGQIQAEVVGAQATLTDLMRDPDAKWFQDNIGKAKAVLIGSEVLKKARVLKTGAGGPGVLLVKGADGKWRGPAFVTIAMEPTALKEGVVAAQVAALVMTDKGVAALMAGTAKLGGEVSYAAGPVGAASGPDPAADLVGYSRTKGAYGTANLDGASVKINDDWDAAYYSSQTVKPKDILETGKASSRDAVSLVNAVTKASGGPPPKKK